MEKRILSSMMLLAVTLIMQAQGNYPLFAEIDSIKYRLFYDYSTDSTQAWIHPSPQYKDMSSIVIPKYVVYHDTLFRVTGIVGRAFEDCTNLKRIVMPDTLSGSIGYKAFSNTGLIELTIPEDANYIGAEQLPNFSSFIDSQVFRCPNVSTLTVGTTFPTMVSGFDFPYSFPNLQKLYWNARNHVGGVERLTGLCAPKGTTENSEEYQWYWVGDWLVMYESGWPRELTQIVFGADVEGIPVGCAMGSNIKAITLPPKLKIIRPYAFDGCTNLVAIHATSTNPASIELEWNVVEKWAANTAITLYVPRGTAQRYREAPQWCEFGDRIVEEDFNFDVNQDGLSDVGDLNAFINKVLGISDDAQLTTDTNGDGRVDIEDVNALINAMLAK